MRQLALGVVLILAAGALLLLSDLDSRQGARAGEAGRDRQRPVRIALVQHNTHPVFDVGVDGMVDGLAESGFRHGETIQLRKLNPFGDSNLANAIAREVVEGGYDLVMTVTTPSILSVANANRYRRIPHVFALVADPVALNIGIHSLDSLDHPPHITGYGSRLPVKNAFRVAREINPDLKLVGTIWNTTEVNSEVQLHDAREICKEKGIRLIEMNVDNSSGVAEAANALISRGVEAIFIPGDITVMSAIDNVIGVAHRAGIPSFTPFPTEVEKGAMFGVGANYYEVGRRAGILAAEILNGRDPAEVPIVDFVPERIALNEQVRRQLRNPDHWYFQPELVARSSLLIEADGTHRKQADRPEESSGVKPVSLQEHTENTVSPN